ncbi:hypothetical protein GTA09_17945 [Rhodococcus hoagii]|nr:hypothetical protein [Prescottella equi]
MEQQPILSLRDTDEATLEEQLPTFIQRLEIFEAKAHWAREEKVRRAEIREVRWHEVRKEAFAALTQQRNAEKLRDELTRRDAAAAMRKYADEIDAITTHPQTSTPRPHTNGPTGSANTPKPQIRSTGRFTSCR